MANITESMGRVGIWTLAFDTVPSSEMVEGARELEDMGFRAVWIGETLGRDPFVNAALMLSGTSELNLATGIANIWARDAMTMANLNRSLNELSGGRFLLGIGVSHHNLVEWVRKHDYSRPYSRMKEYLDLMDKARLIGVGPETEPSRVLAALGPKMLALAAERAAGAHPYLVPPEHTHLAREALGQAWLAPEQMVVFETDPPAAREIARANLDVYLQLPNYANNLVRLGYSAEAIAGADDSVVDALVAWGDEQAVADRVRAHLDAGADHVCVQVLTESGSGLPLEEWRRVAEAVSGLA